MASVKVPVNGQLLAHARASHGLAIDTAARALGVPPERLGAWEEGQQQPTLNQVRKVASLYQRTPAYFLLTRAPSGTGLQRPTDFRGSAGRARSMSNALAREIARARARRHHLLQLGEPAPTRIPSWPDVLEHPATVARRMRDRLGVTVPAQRAFPDTNRALDGWIRAVEAQGVLVFQMSGVTPTECRGFSIYEDVLPIIVLNGADRFGARQFTLMHEIGHLLSRTSAVCELWNNSGVEARCNDFAANLLMPPDAVVQFLDQGGPPTPEALGSEFHVSGSAAAVRLRIMQRITQKQLEAYLKEAARAAIAQREAEKERGRTGGPAPALLKVRNLGPRFVGTVLEAMHDERISLTDAAQILETKVQLLDKLETEVDRRALAS